MNGQGAPLIELLANLEEESVLALVRQRVASGDGPLAIIEECNAGMRKVGERYHRGSYFLSGLIMAGEIFREVMELMQPVLKGQSTTKTSGRVLLGTVQGDIHDIGKDMVGLLLTCYGFMVVDLGTDVAPEEFVRQVCAHEPNIVGLSGVLTASHAVMRETVERLRGRPCLTDRALPVIIGGGMIDDQICRYVGADYWVADAMSGVRLCQTLMTDPRCSPCTERRASDE
ncbi:MAG TPA: cobalamin-dependent protein [Spirochaetia bacterium]|nr:cobalamin-dependent protein [Spirochaetia bacterium]